MSLVRLRALVPQPGVAPIVPMLRSHDWETGTLSSSLQPTCVEWTSDCWRSYVGVLWANPNKECVQNTWTRGDQAGGGSNIPVQRRTQVSACSACRMRV